MQQINPYSSVQCAVVAPLIAVGIPVTKVAFVFKLNALCRHVLFALVNHVLTLACSSSLLITRVAHLPPEEGCNTIPTCMQPSSMIVWIRVCVTVSQWVLSCVSCRLCSRVSTLG